MGNVNSEDFGLELLTEENENSLTQTNSDLLLWQGVDHWLCEWNEEC